MPGNRPRKPDPRTQNYENRIRTGDGTPEQDRAGRKIFDSAEKGVGGTGFQIRGEDRGAGDRIDRGNREGGPWYSAIVARPTCRGTPETSLRVGRQKGTGAQRQ